MHTMKCQLIIWILLVSSIGVLADIGNEDMKSNWSFQEPESELSNKDSDNFTKKSFAQNEQKYQQQDENVSYEFKEVKVPVFHPFPVEISKKVPVPYPVKCPIPVIRQRPFPVYRYKPVHVPRYAPYPVYKYVPVPYKVPVKIPYPVKVKHAVWKPYPVIVIKKIPVYIRKPIYIEQKFPYFVDVDKLYKNNGGTSSNQQRIYRLY